MYLAGHGPGDDGAAGYHSKGLREIEVLFRGCTEVREVLLRNEKCRVCGVADTIYYSALCEQGERSYLNPPFRFVPLRAIKPPLQGVKISNKGRRWLRDIIILAPFSERSERAKGATR